MVDHCAGEETPVHCKDMSHRPTFNPAVAAASFGYGGTKLSVKDQAAHTKLKYRQQGQSSQQEMKAYNMKIELERREAALKNEKQLAIAMVEREEKEVIKESVPALEQPLKHDFHDADIDFGDSEDSEDSIRYFLLSKKMTLVICTQ